MRIQCTIRYFCKKKVRFIGRQKENPLLPPFCFTIYTSLAAVQQSAQAQRTGSLVTADSAID